MQEYINAQFDELTCGVAELKQQTPGLKKSQMYVPMPSDGDIKSYFAATAEVRRNPNIWRRNLWGVIK